MTLLIASTHGEIPTNLNGADLLELRIDGLENPKETVVDLLTKSPIPTIVTCRSVSEGGMFDGTEDERIAMYQAATQCKNPPRYIDVEFETLSRHPLFIDAIDRSNTGIILSSHDIKERPQDLFQRAAAMQDIGDVDVVKLVWRARSIRDNLDCFELLRTKQQPMIAMCMGEYGLMSRVLAPKFGGFGVYGSVDGHEATAPHQPTIAELNLLFRFKDIDTDTKLFGVIGSHVQQSAGPAFHNAAFEVADMNAVYLPIPIPPEWEHLKATFLELFHCEHLNFAGASITLPHKTNMLKLVKELHGSIHDLCSEIGATNTVAMKDGSIQATNTDASAISTLLQGADRVLVLGGGGAARAAIWAMANQGATVYVSTRNKEQAKTLASELPCTEYDDSIQDINAIINCTPIGMRGTDAQNEDAALLLASNIQFQPPLIVFDSVYLPTETPMMIRAKEAGCKTVTGGEMFRLQATLQQKLWS